MKPISRRKALISGAALCAAGSLSRDVFANGDEFFGAEEIPGQTEFVYFGSVKDEKGKYLDNVEVTLIVSDPPLTYLAYTDVLGRYRTLDAGRALLDLGYEPDPQLMTLSVARIGYAQTRRMNRSPTRAKKGAFEVNFVMSQLPGSKAKKDADK